MTVLGRKKFLEQGYFEAIVKFFFSLFLCLFCLFFFFAVFFFQDLYQHGQERGHKKGERGQDVAGRRTSDAELFQHFWPGL